jgi:8-oxo-dGTP pyrophosphatase MutT (NUDIX family)
MDPFLDSQSKLVPAAATAAIILIEGGRYLLQHRDAIPQIWFPDHWCMFGGGTEPGETDAQGMRREILEEISLDIAESEFRYFSQFDFDFGFSGHGKIRRTFFEMGPFPVSILDRIVLKEGQGVNAFTFREAMALQVTPYDSFGLWLHANQVRLHP